MRKIKKNGKKYQVTYLKTARVLEFVAFIASFSLEIGITAQYLISPLLNILRIFEDFHLFRRYLLIHFYNLELSRLFNSFVRTC